MVMKERLAIFSCIALFISWYLFTGYVIIESMQVDMMLLWLMMLPVLVIVSVMVKVIKQMKKEMHVK